MTRMLGKLLAMALALTLVPAVAPAAVPDPRFCVIDPIGVGNNSGVAVGGTPVGFDVAVRDVNDSPLLNSDVTLDFSASGVRAYTVQSAGTTVDATARTVSRVATTGSTNLALRTGGFTNSSAVLVTAKGVVIGHVQWRSTDIDGLDGKPGLGDLTYFTSRYLSLAAAPECNFDLSASDVPDLADFKIFASEYLSGVPGTYAW